MKAGLGRMVVEDTVLIVDQDMKTRIIAEGLLRTRGRHVLGVRDGTEACDVVRCEGAAVVVLSLPSPAATSLDLLPRLRGQLEGFPGPTPRIVVVAPEAKSEFERCALRLGADAFLHKPAGPARFIATVEGLMVRATSHHVPGLGLP